MIAALPENNTRKLRHQLNTDAWTV